MNYVAPDWMPAPHDSDGPARTKVPLEPVEVTVEDLRHAAKPASLAVNGFELREHRTSVSDFLDGEQIETVYLREVEDLIRTVSGAKAVFAYPRAVQRSEQHSTGAKGIIADVIAPMVHIDATERSIDMIAASALARAGRTRPPERRVAYYTVWRSLRPPPQDQALAFCDVRTMRTADLIPADSLANPGSEDERIEYYLLKHSPRHRWFYYSGMEPHEVLVFRQFDSAIDGPSGCAHSSFTDPRVRRAAPRLSIEARACAFFD